ncbi:MAG: hypothetical protein AAF633_14370 [Chloroflexota bacterium]
MALIIAILFGSACQIESQSDVIPTNTAETTVAQEPIAAPTSTNSPVPPTVVPAPTAIHETPTSPPSPSPIPTETHSPTATTDLNDLAIRTDHINIYPVPRLFAGDVASFQIGARVPEGIDPYQIEVEVLIDGETIVYGTMNASNLGGDILGLYTFAWDTTFEAGSHSLEIRLDPADKITVGDEDPANNIYTQELQVALDKYRPLKDQNAEWLTYQTRYANIHVVKGTAASRDYKRLIEVTDASIEKAIDILNEPPSRRYDLYFIDRVIGQGGYAGGSIVISYLDRNYAGGRIEEVITHETIHLLDQQFTPNGRLVFLAEGVAVWGTGGHYKPENLSGRAAALLSSGLYIPIEQLVADFYPVQHEIGYLQAGAFVQYLVDTYGYDLFRSFYSQFNPNQGFTKGDALSFQLEETYGKTLAELEQEWLTYLSGYDIDPNDIADLNASIRFYELMRRYQLTYDPTAHFLQAWLPNPNELLNRGMTAELTRHPEEEINLIIEAMLTEADFALQAQDFQQVEVLLSSVERVLNNDGLLVDPLSQAYKDIVMRSKEQGYEVQYIEMVGSEATAFVTNPYTPNILTLRFIRDPGGWQYIQ